MDQVLDQVKKKVTVAQKNTKLFLLTPPCGMIPPTFALLSLGPGSHLSGTGVLKYV